MRKETITYTDYNGLERTEDFYFNLTKAEVYEMEMTTNGGLIEMVQQIVKAKNVPAIADIFKTFILKAYGEKAPLAVFLVETAVRLFADRCIVERHSAALTDQRLHRTQKSID